MAKNADTNHNAMLQFKKSDFVQIKVKTLASCLKRGKIRGFPKVRRNSIPQSCIEEQQTKN